MSERPPRLPVTLLGATGSVGQRFVELLADHPQFELAALAASPEKAGRPYGEAVRWMQAAPLPEAVAQLTLSAPDPPFPGRLVFSALDAGVAGALESRCARAGHLVVSNARNHRMDADVPLVVPEINPDHLELLERQGHRPGGLIANPNCSTIGLALALAPLQRAFGVKRVHVVTLQALSGAGVPGVSSMEMLDNVMPFIPGEEQKLATETCKIFGRVGSAGVEPADLLVSAQCNRVAVLDGHLECVSLELDREVERDEILAAWTEYRGEPQERRLHSAPARPIVYLAAEDAPQPRRHRDLEGGMAVSIGRLNPCPVLGWRFVLLSHNTLRGAAKGALLVAELALARGLVSA
jgi:aspartate-semialdehyde dehydrogenase